MNRAAEDADGQGHSGMDWRLSASFIQEVLAEDLPGGGCRWWARGTGIKDKLSDLGGSRPKTEHRAVF